MPLSVTSEDFAKEYRACFQDPERDSTLLLEMVTPFLTYWSENLKQHHPDIHMVSLLRLLSPNISEALEAVDAWVAGIEETHSLQDELVEIFYDTLRSMRYFPTNASAIMVEYVVALDFKRKLKDLIKCYHPLVLEDPPEDLYHQDHPDWFLLKHLSRHSWDIYLIDWLARGYNIPTISSITHVPEDTIRNDVRNLCHLVFSIDKPCSANSVAQTA